MSPRNAPTRDPGYRYSLFGLTLDSNIPLTYWVTPASVSPDITLTFTNAAPCTPAWGREAEYTRYYHDNGVEEVLYCIYHLGTCDIIDFPERACFYLWPDRIICHLLNQSHIHTAENQLLATVLSFWLERQGTPVLHASAVSVNDCVVAFLSHGHNGKTGLAATLMQEGHALLTDDFLPVQRDGDTFLGQPAYPTMRMWPDEAQHFLGDSKALPLVHPELSKLRVPVGPGGFGSFCHTPRPIGCLYVAVRFDTSVGNEEITIKTVSPSFALIELIRYSFAARIVEAMGWQPKRLSFLSDMVKKVPIRRVAYPSGFGHLSRVREAILRDVAALT